MSLALQRFAFSRVWAMICGAIVVVFLYTASALYLYAYHPGVMPIPPVVWLALVGGAGLLLALFKANWRVYWASGLAVWSMCYLALGVWGFLLAGSRGAAAQELAYMLVTAFLVTAYVLICAEEVTQRWLAPLLTAAVLFAVLMNLVDVVKPGTFSASFGRAAGLYVNPNISALAITSGMVASIAWLSPRWRPALIVFCGLGVFVTFSRGGILVYLAATAVLLHGKVTAAGGVLRRALVLVLLGALVLPLTPAGRTLLDAGGAVQKKLVNRILNVEAVSQSDQSYSSRAEVARHALNTFADHPFIGRGLGATRTWELSEDTHNIYLKHLAVFGILGLGLFPSFVLLVSMRGRGELRVVGTAMCVSMLLAGVTSHNVLEDRAGLFCASFMAAMITRQRLGRAAE